MREQRPQYSTVEQEEKARVPIVWLVVLGLVVAGIIVHITLKIMGVQAMVIWPFIFAVSVLLIINQASSEHAVGVPPIQAYGFFFGTLLAFFAFVWLVSATINPWVVVGLAVGAAIYIAFDWRKRRAREKEIERRRLAGLCVKCLSPVRGDLEEYCLECGAPVNPERLSLFRLGKAIGNKDQSTRARQTLAGTTPSKADTRLHQLQQQRANRFRRKK